jgi:hypothetical protein
MKYNQVLILEKKNLKELQQDILEINHFSLLLFLNSGEKAKFLVMVLSNFFFSKTQENLTMFLKKVNLKA